MASKDRNLRDPRSELAVPADRLARPRGPANSVVNDDLQKVILVCDPGHGGSDRGCAANGIVEKDTAYRLVSAARHRVAQSPDKVMVFPTRDGDFRPSFGERAAVATKAHADAAVSLHINASAREDVAGLWLFWKSDCKKSQRIAEHLRDHAPSYFRQYPIRIWEAKDDTREKGDEWLARPQHVLELYRCPAVLVEFGFATNPGDAAYLRGTGALEDFADLLLGVAAALRRLP